MSLAAREREKCLEWAADGEGFEESWDELQTALQDALALMTPEQLKQYDYQRRTYWKTR